jgi:biopolymer transport protein ExbD
MSQTTEARPAINVTPLIDVLLVLLIIFMVISPLKPSSFKASIPSPPKTDNAEASPLGLVVTVASDLSLKLNNEANLGSVAVPEEMIARLRGTFTEREKNGAIKLGTNEIEKTVFIKAPRSLKYGEMAKVVDAVKQAGASPIGLQIDQLD